MIYTELTKRAMVIAYNAHHGQLDKSGVPYIFHPYHLAEQMTDEISTCAALLHDTVEDTNVTLRDLACVFPHEVVEAVRLLTHDDSVDYFDYVRKIGDNPIAAKVKRADLMHNLDASRLGDHGNDDEKVRQRREKYMKALRILDGEE